MKTPNLRTLLLATASAVATLLLQPALGQNVATTFDRNIPDECHQKMKAFTKDGHKILCVAFPPAGGNRWTIITDKTFFNRNVPQECHDKMVAYKNAGHKILCVAYPPAGGNRWSLITNKTFFNRGIPNECHERMKTFRNAGNSPIWVAFPPAGGNRWSVLTTKGSYFNRGIPQECHDKMGQLSSAGHKVRTVAYPHQGGNRWTITTNKGFFNRGVPNECHRVMRAMTKLLGGVIQSVAYDADSSGFVVLSSKSPSAGRPPGMLTDGNEFLMLDNFSENLKARLKGQTVKYAFAIRYGSVVHSGADGWKRTAASPPAQEFSIYDRFNPASVSKTITALAVLHALEANRLSVNTKIYHFLPDSWSIPSSVRSISFKDLLRHRSGFRSSYYGSGYDTYQGLKATVENGVKAEDKVYDYENVNYALARILVAYLDGYPGSSSENVEATQSAARFKDYLNAHIFGPLGITTVNFKADANEPTRFYPNPPGNSNGTVYGDWTLKAGGAGIHVSIAELTVLLHRLANSQTILSSNMRQQMDQLHLGWDRTITTAKGKLQTKGGFFPGSWNGGAELRSTVMSFENGLEIAAVYNGDALNNGDGIGGAVIKAYEESWLTVPTLAMNANSLSFAGKKGHRYEIQKSTNLKNWQVYKTINGRNGEIVVDLGNDMASKAAMYRVQVTRGTSIVAGLLDLSGLDILDAGNPFFPKVPPVVKVPIAGANLPRLIGR